MAWAPGKGMKGKEYKDYWEAEEGASYIPYAKIANDVDLDLLEEGGTVDEDTMPENLQGYYHHTCLLMFVFLQVSPTLLY